MCGLVCGENVVSLGSVGPILLMTTLARRVTRRRGHTTTYDRSTRGGTTLDGGLLEQNGLLVRVNSGRKTKGSVRECLRLGPRGVRRLAKRFGTRKERRYHWLSRRTNGCSFRVVQVLVGVYRFEAFSSGGLLGVY